MILLIIATSGLMYLCNIVLSHDLFNIYPRFYDLTLFLGYGNEHLDRFGVYHLMGGNLPLVGCKILSVDNFLRQRPREWGIFKPGVTAPITNIIIRDHFAAEDRIVTYPDNDF